MQVQFTEQPQNKHEVHAMLDFYFPHRLNQISVNKMFVVYDNGNAHVGLEKSFKRPAYKVGTCANYGGYMVQTNGSVLGCCGEIYFYPKLRDKIPNIFKQSLQECKEQSEDLYLRDEIFINYCKNCSIYAIENRECLEKKFIYKNYFALKYSTNERYFVIPEYLRGIPEDVLLFMYENNMVKAIKDFKEKKE